MSEEIKQDIEAEFTLVSEETPAPAEPTSEELAAAQAAAEAEAALQAKANAVASQDLVLLIDKYLSDKAELRDENDSLNIANNSIFRWEFKNISQPSIEQLYELIEPVKDEQEQIRINAEAQAFLDATDWMVIRAMEKGEELSPEFKAERQAARDRIVK
jgi:hypothetical protein